MEGKSLSKKKTLLAALAVAALTVIAIVVINLTKKSGVPMMFGGGKPSGEETPPVSVRTAKAAFTTLTDYVITNGEVQSQSSIEVYPSMNGKLAAVNVMLGSAVRAGDVIARIDPSEPGTNFALSPVAAPISGNIISSPLKRGAKVSTASVIAMIGDLDNLQVSANIPERYVAELKIGLKAEVSLEAYPDAVFAAEVARISPVVDAATRTKTILLTFEKKDPRINAGMFAKVKLYTSTYAGSLTIPSDAVITQDEQNYIFVLNDDGTVSKRGVRIGKSVDGVVQVTDNLAEGEKVVYEGMLSLADGVKARDIANSKADGAKDAAGRLEKPAMTTEDAPLMQNGSPDSAAAAGTQDAAGMTAKTRNAHVAGENAPAAEKNTSGSQNAAFDSEMAAEKTSDEAVKQ
ncbi:MAG: efflux RND transporter periplasmic adaptor subunit [Treponema sp.]